MRQHFNDRLNQYLSTPPTDKLSEQNHTILKTLKDTNRSSGESLALLLQLFGTHPQKGKEQFNTIDIDNFAQSIDELQHADNFDLINFTISPTNPALEQIKQQYGPSPEDDLMENLDTITDTEKVETIIP